MELLLNDNTKTLDKKRMNINHHDGGIPFNVKCPHDWFKMGVWGIIIP
jgi:hypothetical protein